MASVAPSSTNSSASRWGAKNAEPGSAFSGLSRGRARGGRGAPRGGRGGRGGGRGGRPPTESISGRSDTTKVDSPVDKPTISMKGSVTDKPSESTVPSTSKPKSSSRRPSRTVPSLVLGSSTDSSPASNRPASRRKRSTNRSPASAMPATAGPLSSDAQFLHPRSPGPLTAPIKDAPPHINSSEVKVDITALVERVRASAMAENRPSTPGSHIDWAGDDDDSLPDLNDWGVTTSSGIKKVEEISPIFVDGLKPLPDPEPKLATPPSVQSTPLDTESTLKSREDTLASASAAPNPSTFSQSSRAPAHSEADTAGRPDVSVPQAYRDVNTETAGHPGSTGTMKPPLHPSLPPKPIGLGDSQLGPFKSGATPMRGKAPVKAVPDLAAVQTTLPQPSPQAIEAETVTSAAPSANLSTVVVKLPDAAPESASFLRDSSNKSKEDDDDSGTGLTQSMHAPKNSDLLSPPPSFLSSSSDPGSFKPSHVRAHTVGRPPSFALTPPTHGAPPRFSRSAASSPKGGVFVPHHSRNHSSPPVSSSHRTPHNTRPVITGAAISRLARTIGTTVAPTRTATAAAKE
ncbi:hypothetical protein HGRIS_009642 [Hohenbuehelia grisea]|uniref:Uncharacterized protein n=1 Tax=Hohenbuehelia grisea TaxID=104357 RepID=A0ABR3J1S2_9AGAR